MKKIIVEKTASKGIVLGKAFIIEKQELTPSSYGISDVESEIKKYEAAVEEVAKKLEVLAKDSQIFEAHLEVVRDIALLDGVTTKIKDQTLNAQLALQATADEFCSLFEMMDNEYMRERAADIRDVRDSLMRSLKGLPDTNFDAIQEQVILIAKDLAPSDTAKLNLQYILGFITEEGGVTSHVSIMARSAGIPALVGVKDLFEQVKHGDFLVMDASSGEIIVDPTEEVALTYKQRATLYMEKQKELESLSHLPAVTLDGREVKVCANVGNVIDVRNAYEHHADGVGLFRSEFLYMENTHFPTEEEQFEVYKEAARLSDKELIIRTLDIGGDKALSYYEFEKEENPFLGWRAIRISLELEEVFKAQLRAILRASAFGDVCIMYPMIISMEELTKSMQILEQCKQELDREMKAYNPKIRVGMMIETPASVLCVENFAKHVDFFSIGTNDLTQYLLAVDRGNKKIAAMYNSFHPAVLQAINRIICAGHEQGIPVGMCGEFASDERAARLLLGMGLDEFSVSAGEVANIKNIIRNSNYEESKHLAEKVQNLYSIDEIMDLLKG